MMSFLGKQRKVAAMVAGALALASAGAYATQQDGNSQGNNAGHDRRVVKHVLLLSIDGLHEQDLARCIGANTCPNIAVLAQSGVTYTNAITCVDNSIGYIVAALKQANLYLSTAVIVTSKHGQSPTDHTKLVKNGDTLTKLLEANNYLDPNGNFGRNNAKTGNLNDGSGLVGTGFAQTDDVGLIRLRDRNQRTAVVQT